MKKFLIIFILLIVSTGCVSINSLSYEQIVNNLLASSNLLSNEYRSGYLYYLPKGMRILKNTGSNEIIAKENTKYYLYIDLVSYYKKVKVDFKENKSAVISQKIENGDKFGYLEIKKTTNDKYFIEIMYNYAKIEVIVEEDELKNSIANCATILNSIKYQDKVLANLMEENSLMASEISYNIFETAKTESGYLEIAEEYGQYQEKEETVDPDFIRR